jgi:hypothetical protein
VDLVVVEDGSVKILHLVTILHLIYFPQSFI